jgi:myo-inositol catabolism protein IolC
MKYGHSQTLCVLPFDHRASFSKGLFGEENPTAETIEKVKKFKHIIYESIFVATKELGMPENELCVLVDEIFGGDILRDAVSKGLKTMQTVEKSGQEEFMFEFGSDFGTHLLDFKATFAKALVRYNPEGDADMNKRQLTRLKVLSDFVHAHNIKLLIEPLVPATKEQLESVGGEKHRYDLEVRPGLVVRMIKEMQNAGIECDVWKIEGFEEREMYEIVSAQACNTPEREQVGIIILGRGETDTVVEKWIRAGKGVPGVIGFAVGRTVFWNPLVAFRDGIIDEEATKMQIAKNFIHFYNVFKK